jgi:hypothetical protein
MALEAPQAGRCVRRRIVSRLALFLCAAVIVTLVHAIAR